MQTLKNDSLRRKVRRDVFRYPVTILTPVPIKTIKSSLKPRDSCSFYDYVTRVPPRRCTDTQTHG